MISAVWHWITDNFGVILACGFVALLVIFKVIQSFTMIRDARDEIRDESLPDLSPVDRVENLKRKSTDSS